MYTSQLLPEDIAMLASLHRGNTWLRAVLCTLARRGVALRHEFPDRAQELLQALSPFPWYKGCQFLFDLMEWEDFMLDGPPPEVVRTVLDPSSLRRLAVLFRSMQSHLDGAIAEDMLHSAQIQMASVVSEGQTLPPLEPGFYLYQDVVLGLLCSAAPLVDSENSSGGAGF